MALTEFDGVVSGRCVIGYLKTNALYSEMNLARFICLVSQRQLFGLARASTSEGLAFVRRTFLSLY